MRRPPSAVAGGGLELLLVSSVLSSGSDSRVSAGPVNFGPVNSENGNRRVRTCDLRERSSGGLSLHDDN